MADNEQDKETASVTEDSSGDNNNMDDAEEQEEETQQSESRYPHVVDYYFGSHIMISLSNIMF
jgi:hypothetical protein